VEKTIFIPRQIKREGCTNSSPIIRPTNTRSTEIAAFFGRRPIPAPLQGETPSIRPPGTARPAVVRPSGAAPPAPPVCPLRDPAGGKPTFSRQGSVERWFPPLPSFALNVLWRFRPTPRSCRQVFFPPAAACESPPICRVLAFHPARPHASPRNFLDVLGCIEKYFAFCINCDILGVDRIFAC